MCLQSEIRISLFIDSLFVVVKDWNQSLHRIEWLQKRENIEWELCSYRKLLTEVFLSCPVTAIDKSQRNHTEVYIGYKLIGSGFLLTLTTYISSLFLSMSAKWLSTFFGEAVTSCLLCGQIWTAERTSFFSEFSCSH